MSMTKHLTRLLILLLALGTCVLSSCSQKESPDAAKSAKSVKSDAIALPAIEAQAKGFSVGAMMSNQVVYVFFDPQCPHCGHLWNASQALHSKLRFVWIPVAWINAASLTQGAALLTAADPLARMTEHETALLAGSGGISASSSIAPAIEQSIQANTRLLNSFGAESVPFIVARHAASGQTIHHQGALTTAALASFLGIEAAQ